MVIPAPPAQVTAVQDGPGERQRATDGPARDAQPVAANLAGRHEPALAAGSGAPNAAASEAPPNSFAQHIAAAMPSGADKLAALPAHPQADAAASLGTIPSGASAAAGPQFQPVQKPAPASPAQPGAPPSPAAQITPALVHIAAAPGGAQHVTVRLDPVELGALRVRIERPSGGPVHVTIEAARPETLQLLRQDQPALHRALDQAGLPPEGRIVIIQQASPDTGSQRGAAGDAGGASSGGGGSGGRGGNQGWGGSGSGGGGFSDDAPRRTPWLRAGLDITA